RIGLRRGRALQVVRRGDIVSDLHFGAPEVVVCVGQSWFLPERRLDKRFRLGAVVPFYGKDSQLIPRKNVVGIDLEFALEGRSGLLRLFRITVFRAEFLMQAGLRGRKFD